MDPDRIAELIEDRATEAMGGSVTYTTPGGTATTVSGVWHESAPDERDLDSGRESQRTATLTVSASALALPEEEATVTRSGETWSVETWEPVGTGAWTLHLVRAASRSRTSEGFYRRY